MTSVPAPGARPVRLLKVVPVFAFGGTERQFVNLGLALDPARFDVRFACMRRAGQFLDELLRRRIPVADYAVRSLRRPGALAAQWRLATDLRRDRIQVVHAYNFYANVFAIPAARLAGVPVIASIRDLGAYLSPAQRRLQRWVCRLADRVIVNAHAIAGWLVEEGYDPGRIVVIPNGLDVERFSRVARTGHLASELGLPADAPLVGLVGRVTRLKGIEDFLAAAVQVARRHPRARFLVVGSAADPDYGRELAALVARLGLTGRVVFTGFRPDVERVVAELTVSVLPSLSEGLSNAVLESMAGGVPVIATAVGDTPEVIADGDTGLLVPPRAPAALAGRIEEILEHPDLARRLGARAQKAVERYSIPRLVEATTREYEALAATISSTGVPARAERRALAPRAVTSSTFRSR